MALTKVTKQALGTGVVDSSKIEDGTIVDADVSPSAAISSGKLTVDTSVIESDVQKNAFNISLLGFKMAVNEGLTVFNLVDGVVDEFNDESGTDEAEGSNDRYVAASDYYINSNTDGGVDISSQSAGFTTIGVTEPDTSTAGTNPGYGAGTLGSYTVPTGITSITGYVFGAGGGSAKSPAKYGGGAGGGMAYGNISVSGGDVLRIMVGEGGKAGSAPSGYESGRALGGGGSGPNGDNYGGCGGGASAIFTSPVPATITGSETANAAAPQAYLVGAGGGGAGAQGPDMEKTFGGAGGGLQGYGAGEDYLSQTAMVGESSGGGGSQTQGGQAADGDGSSGQGSQQGNGNPGNLFIGGDSGSDHSGGGGGSGFYGGGGGSYTPSPTNSSVSNHGCGGGGSSYHGNPNVSSGGTYAGEGANSGPFANGFGEGAIQGGNSPSVNALTDGPFAPLGDIGEGTTTVADPQTTQDGEDGYVLITTSGITSTATSTTIVSSTFTSSAEASTARMVVFEENVDTPTLNTDIIASVSRDGGTTFSTATLSDSGYVTGSSGQRILTGQADISGQPTGQSMRWKLALANNQVKIHGVSLQWS